MKTIRWIATPVETVAWTLDINGPDGSPSLSKVLAFAFGIVAARDVWRNGFDAYSVSAMGLIIAAALGRSVFMNWLGRNTFTSSLNATASASTSAATTVTLTGDLTELAKVVTSRRSHVPDIEATP